MFKIWVHIIKSEEIFYTEMMTKKLWVNCKNVKTLYLSLLCVTSIASSAVASFVFSHGALEEPL